MVNYMFTSYLIIAFLMGLGGTIIESVSYLIEHGKLSYRGDKYFWNIPLKPIYAIGGLLLFFTIKLTNSYPWYVSILAATFSVIFWEYISGFFCVHILKERLWDYSKRNANLHGHISWWSSKWWFVISLFFYFILYDQITSLEVYLAKSITFTPYQDLSFFTTTVLLVIALAIIKRVTSARKLPTIESIL
jgi:uncharacterized membrane protein